MTNKSSTPVGIKLPTPVGIKWHLSDLTTIKQASIALNCSYETLRRWAITDLNFPAPLIHIDKKAIYSLEAIVAWFIQQGLI